MVTAVKNKLKKFVAIVLMVVIVMSAMAGCSTGKDGDGTVNILCSVFPVYDWVCEITTGAENVEVELLVDSGSDMHSYQATASDLVKIASCDIFVYVGGVSDGWVEDALKSAQNDKRTVLNLMELLPADRKICANVGHAGEHGHEASHKHENEDEYDEHIWLSVENARILCEKISEEISKVNPDNSDKYTANTNAYCNALEELDEEYKKVCDNEKNKTMVFGGRFPFTYLLNDYGLLHYAAFEGCSAESEASFDTVVFLAGKVDKLGAPAVLSVKGDSEALAKTIIENTKLKNQKIIALDSMQAVTRKDIDDGATYLKIMKANLDAIKIALDY